MLALDHISVRFGGVQALQDVSLALKPGRIHGLIGPNGAGKTTLFNVVFGLVRAQSGRMLWEGRDIIGWPVHRRAQLGLARSFQNLALFGSMTVAEHLRAGLIAQGRQTWWGNAIDMRESEGRTRIAEVAKLLDLESCLNAPVQSLSLALRKKVELGRALASRPRLLMLDEPAAGLDAQQLAELAQLCRTLSTQGVTVLLVEHHMGLVMSLCDHLFVLNFGRLIAQGAPAEVQHHPEVIEAYLGDAGSTADAGADMSGATA